MLVLTYENASTSSKVQSPITSASLVSNVARHCRRDAGAPKLQASAPTIRHDRARFYRCRRDAGAPKLQASAQQSGMIEHVFIDAGGTPALPSCRPAPQQSGMIKHVFIDAGGTPALVRDLNRRCSRSRAQAEKPRTFGARLFRPKTLMQGSA